MKAFFDPRPYGREYFIVQDGYCILRVEYAGARKPPSVTLSSHNVPARPVKTQLQSWTEACRAKFSVSENYPFAPSLSINEGANGKFSRTTISAFLASVHDRSGNATGLAGTLCKASVTRGGLRAPVYSTRSVAAPS